MRRHGPAPTAGPSGGRANRAPRATAAAPTARCASITALRWTMSSTDRSWRSLTVLLHRRGHRQHRADRLVTGAVELQDAARRQGPGRRSASHHRRAARAAAAPRLAQPRSATTKGSNRPGRWARRSRSTRWCFASPSIETIVAGGRERIPPPDIAIADAHALEQRRSPPMRARTVTVSVGSVVRI